MSFVFALGVSSVRPGKCTCFFGSSARGCDFERNRETRRSPPCSGLQRVNHLGMVISETARMTSGSSGSNHRLATCWLLGGCFTLLCVGAWPAGFILIYTPMEANCGCFQTRPVKVAHTERRDTSDNGEKVWLLYFTHMNLVNNGIPPTAFALRVSASVSRTTVLLKWRFDEIGGTVNVIPIGLGFLL